MCDSHLHVSTFAIERLQKIALRVIDLPFEGRTFKISLSTRVVDAENLLLDKRAEDGVVAGDARRLVHGDAFGAEHLGAVEAAGDDTPVVVAVVVEAGRRRRVALLLADVAEAVRRRPLAVDELQQTRQERVLR